MELRKFIGIPNKTKSPFGTLKGYLESICNSELEQKELSQDVTLDLLNFALGVYNTLENQNQLNSRSGMSVLSLINKVNDEWKITK